MSIYKDCDIRGIYGEEFDAEEMCLVGRSIGRRLKGRSIVVAGDVRVSTGLIKEKLLAGLKEEGAHIIDIGIVPTPVAYFAKSKACFDTYALAIVTASHNPAKYNGIKIMFGEYPPTPDEIKSIQTEVRAIVKNEVSDVMHNAVTAAGRAASAGDQAEVKEQRKNATGNMADNAADNTKAQANAGAAKYEQEDVEERYAAYIKTLVKGGNGLKVVLDIGNGTTAGIAPRLYRALGYEVVELFGEPDGNFPNRNPNPADYRNLDAVRAKVLEEKADFGVAFDGDGDRAVFIDDKGRAVVNEKALIMLTEYATGRSIDGIYGSGLCQTANDPDKCGACASANDAAKSGTCGSENDTARTGAFSVVYDQKCSKIVSEAIETMGGKAILERSGHAFIKKTFLGHGSILAGEISGHFFFKELGHDDGIYAGLCMGDYIASRKTAVAQGAVPASRPSDQSVTFSDLADRLPDPVISPDLRYKVPYDKMNEVLDKLKVHYEALGMPISTYDGVRVSMPDGWLLVRKSVTEEAMTVKIEAESGTRINEMIHELEKDYFTI